MSDIDILDVLTVWPPFGTAAAVAGDDPDPEPSDCGTDMMSAAAAWMAAQLQATAGTWVIYQRGTRKFSVCATFGSSLLKLDAGDGGIRMERTDRDFVVPAAALALDGSPILPQRGDRVRHNDGVNLTVYEVLPYGDEPHWRYSDPFKKMIRLHTKRISTEAV